MEKKELLSECTKREILTEVYRRPDKQLRLVAEASADALNFCMRLEKRGSLDSYVEAYRTIDWAINTLFPYYDSKELLREALRIATEGKNFGKEEVERLIKYAEYQLESSSSSKGEYEPY